MKLPNIDPKLFSLSAVLVGYLLIDDLSATEQNALGNWLMLAAQVISTNAYYKQLLTEREQDDFKNPDITNILTKLSKAIEEALNKFD